MVLEKSLMGNSGGDYVLPKIVKRNLKKKGFVQGTFHHNQMLLIKGSLKLKHLTAQVIIALRQVNIHG